MNSATSVKAAEVRFYVDADLLGLAKILVQVRRDVTYPGDPGGTVLKRRRPTCPIAPDAKDSTWLPQVSARDWLVISRDRRIREHRAELAAVKQYGARLVVLASDDAATKFGQLEVLMCQWRAIEGLLASPGPFIYAASRTTLRAVPLD